jgi:hypothetical protein
LLLIDVFVGLGVGEDDDVVVVVVMGGGEPGDGGT